MKATIDKDGRLCIDMSELVHAMAEPDRRTLAKYAVFEEVLLEGLIGALVDGHMWSEDDDGPWWHGGNTYTKLRLKLLPLLPEVTAEAVRHIEAEARRERASAVGWRDACFKLERLWRESEYPPERRENPYADPMTKEQAAAYLATVEAKLAAEQPEIDRLRALLRTACEHGHRLAGLECSSEDEARFEAIAKEGGVELVKEGVHVQ